MRISIPLENPYPVEMTTALKFDSVIEKIDFEVWGALLGHLVPHSIERTAVRGRFLLFLVALWLLMMMQKR